MNLPARHLPHAAFQIFASWLFTVGFALFASVAAIATLGRWAPSLTPWLLRVWGRTMLWIAGITLEGVGLEHLRAATGKAAVFNHASMLDAFVIAAITPHAGVAAIKREVLYYPGVGLAV